jgi:hypothetical protein
MTRTASSLVPVRVVHSSCRNRHAGCQQHDHEPLSNSR